MWDKLIIVESPNKVKTIQSFVGSEYKVMPSIGHIVEMVHEGEYGLGINFNNWEPIYQIAEAKKKIFGELQNAVKQAKMVYIATDPDREGEAIGENLVTFLKLQNKYKRIKYNEIIKEKVLNALINASVLDEDLIKAQKTRRILDRIIGFRLTSFIGSQIRNAPTQPTAGRVQSVALKLVVEREEEIVKFVPVPYFSLIAKIGEDDVANYYNPNALKNQKSWILPEELNKFQKEIEGDLIVKDVIVGEKKEKAISPLKQADIYKKAGVGAKVAEKTLQELFEGFGDHGLITYPRTDSTQLSQDFIEKGHKFIETNYGVDYVAKHVKGSAGDQDGHEALRPTDLNIDPDSAKTKYGLSEVQDKIYRLIYITTLQALMNVPIKSTLKYELENHGHHFEMNSAKIIFDGYYVVKEGQKTKELPKFEKGQSVSVEKYIYTSCKTTPPKRFDDGSLIELLDKLKIGRPSTFAATVSKIRERKFVEEEGKMLVPTDFGKEVLNKLLKFFDNIINEAYTSQIESELDYIAEAKAKKEVVLETFYTNFKNVLDKANANQFSDVTKKESASGICKECGSELVYERTLKGVKFVQCNKWPLCLYSEYKDK